jgi:Tfp pilus assembly protein PilX
MVRSPDLRIRRQRGGALITALAMSLVIAFILAGVGTMTVSHYSRVTVESNYAGAFYVAEAGINYELNKIGTDYTTADQAGSTSGVSYNFGGGTYRVYCANLNGTTPWDPTTSATPQLYITSTGTLNGVSRTVRIRAKSVPPASDYAIYAITTGTLTGSAMTINGNIGTNGTWSFAGHPGVIGSVVFNGPGANWSGGNPGDYNVVYGPRPILWPTVDQIANQMFPGSGGVKGLAWLATHNDNASVGLGSSLSSSVTLPPGNYYFTDVSMNGNKSITVNNATGPVNIWVGPSGGSAQASFKGCTSLVSLQISPNVHIYVATTGGIDIGGNNEMDAGIYAYTLDSSNNPIGQVTSHGNPSLVGMIVSPSVTVHGNNWIYAPGLFTPITTDYYAFDDYWAEISPL